MKRLLKLVTNKIFVVGLSVVFQLWLIFSLFSILGTFSRFIFGIFEVVGLLLVLRLVSLNQKPSYTLAWSILIIGIPMFGSLLYLMFGNRKIPAALRDDDIRTQLEMQELLKQDPTIIKAIERSSAQVIKQVKYLANHALSPVFKNTEATYYSTGEAAFEAMLEDLRSATDFIFMEYFIIKEGYMWDVIEAILVDKVNQGVKVRLMYDEFGGINLPANFAADLRLKGLEVVVFNPLVFKLAIFMNNRDHRKILVVDGRLGYVGGLNIADEYINREMRFGHWKDGAVKIEGDAVWSLSVMFLRLFHFYDNTFESIDRYRYKFAPETFDDGYAQPFGDAPTDGENVSETVHMQMITQATDYLYLVTPYLVIGDDILTAMCVSAKSGVDVRILLPHIPDKKTVNQATKSRYEYLLENGVKIYEYKPGFIHTKMMVSDDQTAVIGTINMDYRSYYMHFECGILFYRSKVVLKAKEDFLETLEESLEITLEQARSVSWGLRMFRAIMNLFQGLL